MASTSTGEDADLDIPLTIEYTAETTAMVTVMGNLAPTADAGPDQLLQAAADGTAAVTLDGSGSSDPDSDALTYAWTGPFGTAIGVSPAGQITGGVHPVTLTVEEAEAAPIQTRRWSPLPRPAFLPAR